MSPNPFGEVPALPIAIPFGIIVFAAQLFLLTRGQRFTWPRATIAAAIAIYAAGIVANTVFPIFLDPAPRSELWSPALALIPFHDYELRDALTNVVVFIPLGILIPLVMRRPSGWKVLLTAAAVSLTIEVLQLVTQKLFSGGHVADINDFIWNTLGGVSGFAIYRALIRVPILSRFMAEFRWHSDHQASDTP
ncbi:VanZ family protein [Frigoribacterium sp. MCBA15_019]|jgi:glycopeptide antibiotics resistance protein|uniref:VanZ family protein n=1 Tax=Frigoribacterium sp. MCBA15_019 TaxID=1898745 RepID=UPI0008DE11C5|nr:VanZ family protein [Frigoribacterium sp. MCBA15_019]OII27352.1 hypothetical protein BIV04_01975 [Frigoribacterium sp. MCBA15_019]